MNGKTTVAAVLGILAFFGTVIAAIWMRDARIFWSGVFAGVAFLCITEVLTTPPTPAEPAEEEPHE